VWKDRSIPRLDQVWPFALRLASNSTIFSIIYLKTSQFSDNSDAQLPETQSCPKSNDDQVLLAKFLVILAVTKTDESIMAMGMVFGHSPVIEMQAIRNSALMLCAYLK
jgi:hypothetical protein